MALAGLLILSLFGILALAPGESSPSGIQGTYRLVSRDLPDGKRFSIANIAEYELTEDTYSETSLYRMANDEIGGAGFSYDVSGKSGSAPVTRENGRIAFGLPLWGEPSVVFTAEGFTATREGAFVDHWERVD